MKRTQQRIYSVFWLLFLPSSNVVAISTACVCLALTFQAAYEASGKRGRERGRKQKHAPYHDTNNSGICLERHRSDAIARLWSEREDKQGKRRRDRGLWRGKVTPRGHSLRQNLVSVTRSSFLLPAIFSARAATIDSVLLWQVLKDVLLYF